MSLLFLDTFAGISGDMFLGLLVDLGVPLPSIQEGLDRLPVTGYQLHQQRTERQHVAACKIIVEHEEQHHHRTWRDIDRMLAESSLKPTVVDLARRIFRRIGEAEAKIHGRALDEVHFHEVGAIDSIVDIVGAAVGLDYLHPDRIVCAPLPLTRGTVHCAHGSFPLPAPATLEILRGLPTVGDTAEVELVTPTGAAIAAETAEFGDLPAMTLERVGYGAGDRQLSDRPNLLRGLLGTADDPWEGETDRITILECHLDDANPEWLGALMEHLLEEGALDVAFAPLQMKKNRPGVHLTVLAPQDKTVALARRILRESTAGGLRYQEATRFKLRRQIERLTTPLGEVHIKLFYEGDKLLRLAPEFDSCQKLAQSSGLPLPEIYRLAEQTAYDFFRKKG
ncbi:protein of unknown function DUF111 [Syntrophotalea carbinolica DSM 2380]|uniref:Putative nickel insertion protein n=1 Tax=Syntrophotalea carbinolica (strain DSM 2380 / NBRC 103641 / GraBd1) TaxID=338963 RepID=Y2401_SYNC1|nr:nickel pincer cofactor biosynthesis protein LarC [Syntrophotalea carbinolica]Q3A1W7.1 RecName: Full=Putative nickel insertion protein [Syntrophotalea carbinolica DSM 2380]ABA89640.1 protein of unknown function DUF111 [Syntrophotalea carbinolica DSM 2380]